MGLAAQDTSELFFEDCRIPKENLLGDEGMGFLMLMRKLQQERLVVAIGCQGAAERVLKDTIEYCQERKAFGRPISKFQNTQFKLADCDGTYAGRVSRQRVFDGQALAIGNANRGG